MLEVLPYFLLAGCFIGFLSGLFGIGGGALLVPLFIVSLRDTVADEVLVKTAVATSLAVIGCMTASSTWMQHSKKMIDWSTTRWLVIGLMAGVVVGGWYAASQASGELMRALLGVLLLLSAAQTIAKWQPPASLYSLSPPTLLGIGGTAGVFSAMGGIGGGIIIVPALLATGLGIHRATAASAAGGFFIAITASLIFALQGTDIAVPYSTGYIYWPAVLGVSVTGMVMARAGVWVNHRSNAEIMRWSFAAVTLTVSGWLLLGN